MPRKFTPKIITANHLFEGDVIYLADGDAWTRQFGEARVFLDESEANSILERWDARRDIHTGAYLADAVVGADGRPRPGHFRELFRATGPSNYFHGKQAEFGNV